MRKRLDVLLVDKELTSTRSKGKSLIEAGYVFVNGQRAIKPGDKYLVTDEVEVKGERNPYVSRGGLKLAGALKYFSINPKDWVILDGGASTGGFSDCLLQNGAKKIYAIDVGHSQLDPKIQADQRVVSLEKINLRYLKPDLIEEPLDMIVLDVSFISVTKVLAKLTDLLTSNGFLLILVKPQFEVGPQNVGKNGLVRKTQLFEYALKKVWDYAKKLGCGCKGVMPSPIDGSDGNKEFFLFLQKGDTDELTQKRLDEILTN